MKLHLVAQHTNIFLHQKAFSKETITPSGLIQMALIKSSAYQSLQVVHGQQTKQKTSHLYRTVVHTIL